MKVRTWGEQKVLEIRLRRRWLQHLANTGKTRAECAREVGLGRGQLFNLAKDLDVKFAAGVPGPKRLISKVDLVRCAQAGLTQAETAAELKFTAVAISRACKRFGITLKQACRSPAQKKKARSKSTGQKKPKAQILPVPARTLTPLELMKKDADRANARLRAK